MVLGIVGGVILCKGAIDFAVKLLEGNRHTNVESLMLAGIGIITIVASTIVWTGRYLAGGVINIILGIIAVFYGKDAEGLLILISGVLRVMAPKIKD